MSEPGVHLRPLREDDLTFLARLSTERDFSAPFQWGGFKSPDGWRKRLEDDGFLGKDPRELAVAGSDDAIVGLVSWRDPKLFGREGRMWEIGAIVAPEHRGRGVGTVAQRLLVDYLFETTTRHRIVANTEVDNAAERRALERVGFRLEGVLRQTGWREGAWRDVAVYGLLREDLA